MGVAHENGAREEVNKPLEITLEMLLNNSRQAPPGFSF